MLDVIAILQLEHRNLKRLLGFIQHQAIKISEGIPANYRLLEISFEYLSGYPDQCHHPKEDVLYRKLVTRFPDLMTSLKNLVDEHEKLADLTRNLRQVIGKLHPDPPAANPELANQIRVFLDYYHHHMLMEEQHFFPLARHRLSHDDFATIDFALFDLPDPIVDQKMERKFKDLIDEVTRLENLDQASSDQSEESALLANFLDIATFNETMSRIGKPVSMRSSSGGGYEVRLKGNVLVHIPACSEPRAAWCAYFFFKALTRGRDIS